MRRCTKQRCQQPPKNSKLGVFPSSLYLVWCALLQSSLASANHHNGKAFSAELHPKTKVSTLKLPYFIMVFNTISLPTKAKANKRPSFLTQLASDRFGF
jgi:hypothetical protein